MSSSKRIALFFAAAIVLGSLVLLSINSFLAWQAQSKFDARIAAIRAAGEPARLSDLAPAAISRDNNAAAILEQVTNELTAYENEFAAFWETDLGKSWLEAEANEQLPNTEQRAAIEKILDAHAEILKAIVEATECDSYNSLVDLTSVTDANEFNARVLPNVQRIRGLANYGSMKVTSLLASGKRDEAVALAMKLLQIARKFDNEPTVTNYLVAIAIRGIAFADLNRALQGGPVSPQLRAELSQDDNLAPLAHAMVTERAYAVTNIADQTSGFARMLGWPLTNWMLGQMDLLDRAVAASKLSPDELRPNRNMVADDLKKPAPLQGVAEDKNIGPAIMMAFNAEFRRLAKTRAMRVLNALGEYRQRTGKHAHSLDQLSLPTSAAIDPWTGQPFVIKKTDKGWLVYSVGQNCTDDGGRFEKTDDVGFGPPGYGHETNEHHSDSRAESADQQP